jgi:hypothetical protein
VEKHHSLPEAHEYRVSENIDLLQRKDKLVKSFIIDVQTGLISARSLEKNIRLISSLGLTDAQSRKIRSVVEQGSIYSATPLAMKQRRGHLLPSRLFTLRRHYAIFLELFKS